MKFLFQAISTLSISEKVVCSVERYFLNPFYSVGSVLLVRKCSYNLQHDAFSKNFENIGNKGIGLYLAIFDTSHFSCKGITTA